MNDKKERYISSELSDKTQLSVLRSIVGWGYEKIRHSLGRPGQLERAIASGELIPCPLKTPVDTLWTRSVIYWQDWISPSWIPSDSRQCTIDFYKPCQRQDYWPFFAIFNVRYWSLMLSACRHFIITDWRGVFCQHSRFAFFL